MQQWNKFTGSMILEPIMCEDGRVPNEAVLEDQFKHAIYESSNGELNLVKLYWTDGFGWYFGEDGKIIFVLHECKANLSAKTMRGFETCLKKAFLQNIGYYFKIKHKKYTNFPSQLISLAKEKGYDVVQDYIVDNFGLFLMTNERFVSNIDMDDKVRTLLDELEPLVLDTDKSPSKYWEDRRMRAVMEKFDVMDYPFDFMDFNVDIANTGEILNKALNKK